MDNNDTTNSKPYRGFLIFTDIIDKDGAPHARTVVNFPLLGLDDPRYPIFEYVCPVPGFESGHVEARLAIERILNGQYIFEVGHEAAPEVAPGAKRGTFTLTVFVTGQSHSYTWKTPTTFTFQDEATRAAEDLANTYKRSAGWQN